MDHLKREAAARALQCVQGGMKLGLGTGSTAAHFVALLGERIRREKLDVLCIPTSERTREQALQEGIRLAGFNEITQLDLTIDGADEIDEHLRLIKGGGGALLREKIVARASTRMIVIADESKKVDVLGRFPLPVEIVCFGYQATLAAIRTVLEEMDLPGGLSLRMTREGLPFITDEGHMIADMASSRITEPEKLAQRLNDIPGVVDHGLFLNEATGAILASPSGLVTMGVVE